MMISLSPSDSVTLNVGFVRENPGPVPEIALRVTRPKGEQ